MSQQYQQYPNRVQQSNSAQGTTAGGATGQEMAGQAMAGQGSVGQGISGQGTSGQGSAGQGSAGRGMTGHTFRTQNYLDHDVRMVTVERLNQLLADTTDLRSQVKFAHWNVKGMNFYQLHELFDDLAAVLMEHQDLIAERATMLGGQALGTTRRAATNSRIPEMPNDEVTGPEFVGLLADRLAVHDSNLCRDIRAADGYGDLDTADMLNEISREVSKYLWFLESHLQEQPQQAVVTSGQFNTVTEDNQ